MTYTLRVLRRAPGETAGRWTEYAYDTDSPSETVANALTAINARPDMEQNPIRWECSCLQKKCGACAMVINGRPGLACDARLSACGPSIRLEPLRKFPVVADLIVDRSVLYENLQAMRLWLEDEANMPDAAADVRYEAARCLQCGCCLEVCPNFMPGGAFAGMAAAVPMSRLLAEMPASQRRELSRMYSRRVFEGCGKSLSCRDICPAHIDTERMLVNSNAIAVWKRLGKK